MEKLDWNNSRRLRSGACRHALFDVVRHRAEIYRLRMRILGGLFVPVFCGILICGADSCETMPDPSDSMNCGYPDTCSVDQDRCLEICRDSYCNGPESTRAGYCLPDDNRCLCVCSAGVCAVPDCTAHKDCEPDMSGDRSCVDWCSDYVCDGGQNVRSSFCLTEGRCECVCAYTGVSTCVDDAP